MKRIDRIGEKNINSQGLECEIIEYEGTGNITVKFSDETLKKTTYKNFKKGIVLNPNVPRPTFKDRTGEKIINNQGSEMEIIKYINKRNIIIKFNDNYGYTVKSSYSNFSRGNIKNPYFPTVYGKGFSGTKYPIRINGKVKKEYITWKGMLERCYSSTMQEKCPNYIGCEVCEEWLNYENFYEWIHSQENFNIWMNTPLSALDKDILYKNNKLYAPDKCCLVTHEINTIFCIRDRDRGNCCVGVWKDERKQTKQYIAQINDKNHKRKRIGIYDTQNEAFEAYKKEKEKLIRNLAQKEYSKGIITEKCYIAMMNYEIEIND